MQTLLRRSILIVVIWTAVCPTSPIFAQDLNPSMRVAAKELDTLLHYMVSDKVFTDPKNEQVILNSLRGLTGNFHTVGSLPSKFHEQPGFDSSLRLLIDNLSFIEEKFKAGKKMAALWQLQNVPNYCITCHISYNAGRTFKQSKASLNGLSSREKGVFLFATRNFSDARSAFWEAVNENNNSIERNDALRKWLVISTRIDDDFSDSILKLTVLLKREDIVQHDKQIVERWISDLKDWQKDPNRNLTSLELASTLISDAGKSLVEGGTDTIAVKVLRATRMLHELIETGKIAATERAGALLLLGRGYTLIPLYLHEGLGKMYLEQAIIESPESPQAHQAYQLYEHQTLLEFSGSGGVYLPDDEKKRLADLKSKLK
jgi:hypothetical protein